MDHLSGPGSSPSHGAFLVTCALGGGKSKGQKNLNLNLVSAITRWIGPGHLSLLSLNGSAVALGLPQCPAVKNPPVMQENERHGFDPQVGEIPCRREWQRTPVCLPGESHGQRSLVGYRPWGRESQTRLSKQTKTSPTESLSVLGFYCAAKGVGYVHVYPLLFLGFSSHLGHHGALSLAPCLLCGDFSLGFGLTLHFSSVQSLSRVRLFATP